jgi:hypothetical protein
VITIIFQAPIKKGSGAVAVPFKTLNGIAIVTTGITDTILVVDLTTVVQEKTDSRIIRPIIFQIGEGNSISLGPVEKTSLN